MTVLTKAELIQALQSEVRILLHLAGKIDRAKLDYRPTPKQRSTLELMRYLSMMGPTLIRYTTSGNKEATMWMEAEAAANARDLDATIEAIAAQRDTYAQLLEAVSEESLRAQVPGIDGQPTTRGSVLVTGVLASCVAYRMQLFLYLKASGREELGTMDVWAGMDAPAAV
jgi:hypothetical protein